MGILQEDLVPLMKAARRLPRRRNGRPTHVSTLHRWRSKGVRGVRLEAVRVGGIWHTSTEAVERFVTQLSSADQTASPNTSNDCVSLPDKPNDHVEEQLDSVGI
jgi:hypothetical protein